ncbi:MAG: lysylphosphatidylglycerol synthase transmembrane domain-containing protein [Planctomycetota bacterium]
MRKGLQIAIGIIISVALLILAFSKINFADFIHTLKNTNIISLLCCVLFFGISCIFRAFMWRITTGSVKKVGISTLFGGVMVGYMVNNILPLRLGEVFRAYYLASKCGFAKTYALSTVIIERVLDVFFLGLLLLLSLFYGLNGLSFINSLIVLAAWAVIVIAAVFLMINLSWIGKLEKITFIPGRLLKVIKNFLAPLALLRQPRKILLLLTLSLFAWLTNYLAILSVVYYVVPVKFEAAMVLFLFINIGFLIPSSPGAIGVIQIAFLMALEPFGVPKAQALAISLAFHLIFYLFTIGVGLPYFLWAHLKISKGLNSINGENEGHFPPAGAR